MTAGTANSNIGTSPYLVFRLLHGRGFVGVTDGIVKESHNEGVFFPFRISHGKKTGIFINFVQHSNT
jgi:hypothetical protein